MSIERPVPTHRHLRCHANRLHILGEAEGGHEALVQVVLFDLVAMLSSKPPCTSQELHTGRQVVRTLQIVKKKKKKKKKREQTRRRGVAKPMVGGA